MKQFAWVIAVTGVALLMSGVATADLMSLRGDVSLPATNDAAVWHRYINDKENMARAFEQQPPLIPHKNQKYPINLQENKCLDCHMRRGDQDAKSVEMSEAHFVNRQGQRLDHPAGSRHFCTQCHVPQVESEPLVESSFRPLKDVASP